MMFSTVQFQFFVLKFEQHKPKCAVTIISWQITIESNLSFECPYHNGFLLNLEHKSTPNKFQQSILVLFLLQFLFDGIRFAPKNKRNVILYFFFN